MLTVVSPQTQHSAKEDLSSPISWVRHIEPEQPGVEEKQLDFRVFLEEILVTVGLELGGDS